jgi:hypothetical protein
MRKCMFCIAGLCLLLGLLALAAAEQINFSGNWILDKTKSDSPQQMGRGGARAGDGIRGGFPPGRGGMGGGQRGGDIPAGAGRGPGGDLSLVIQHTADHLIIIRKTGSGENERSVEQHFTLDGKGSKNPAPMGGGFINSTVEIKDNALVIQNTQSMSSPNGEMEIRSKEELSLTNGGQTLIITTTRSTPRGEESFKQVFTKQN